MTPDLEARGFTPHPGQALWAKNSPHGIRSLVLNYSPDDEFGGWIEPFVGLIDERVETLIATFTRTQTTHGIRHTLLIGSTKWYQPQLDRQPVHTRYEVLEVVNVLLRWWDKALPPFLDQFSANADGVFNEGLNKLDQLFNKPHPQAKQYLGHELNWALRGIAIRHTLMPSKLIDAMDFHRARMIESGFWDIYGEQIRSFVIALT